MLFHCILSSPCFLPFLIPLIFASPNTLLAATNTKTVTANMEKLEEDRQYLQDVLSRLKEEVGEQGTFSSLTRTLQQYHCEKERMRQIIQRSAGGEGGGGSTLLLRIAVAQYE